MLNDAHFQQFMRYLFFVGTYSANVRIKLNRATCSRYAMNGSPAMHLIIVNNQCGTTFTQLI